MALVQWPGVEACVLLVMRRPAGLELAAQPVN
jgi:hypothetical protein